MNIIILSKCLEELNKDKPNIDYIKGILETVITFSGDSVISNNIKTNVTEKNKELVRTEDVADEETTTEGHYITKPGPIAGFR